MKHLFNFILIIFSTHSFAYSPELINWISSNYISGNIYQNKLSSKEENYFFKEIENKRFIFLGESDHYFEEKYDFRLKFIKSLLKKGYTYILDEMGISDGQRVQKYLETGNEDFLNQLGLYGFKYGHPLTNGQRLFIVSSKRYLRKLREIKKEYPQLVYGGFDLDMYPGTTYLDLDDFFKQYNFSYLNKFKQYIQDSKNSDSQRSLFLTKARQEYLRIESVLKRDLARSNFLTFKLSFLNFVNSVIWQKMLSDGTDIMFALDWRERRMFENMKLLEKINGINQRYIMMGHNGHFTKTIENYTDQDGNKQWYTIGAWINDNYPNQAYALWSMIGNGSHSGHGCPDGKECSFTALPETMEEGLLTINTSKTMFFSTTSKVFKNYPGYLKFMINANEVFSGPIHKQADSIYFIPTVNNFKP